MASRLGRPSQEEVMSISLLFDSAMAFRVALANTMKWKYKCLSSETGPQESLALPISLLET